MTPKTCLITGAGSGIGRSLSMQAGDAGYHVWLVGRRQHMLDEVRCEIGEDRATALVADITDPSDRTKIAETIGNQLDLLINNAGIIDVGPAHQSPPEATTNLIETNLTAPICLTSLLLPSLIQTKGQVANIGSVFGDIAYPYFASYSASKFGLRGYSDALRREISATGVSVTYVAPRATETPAKSAFVDLIAPMGMALDSPEEVAAFTWNAITRRKRVAYPPSKERLFVALQRCAPQFIDKALNPLGSSPSITSLFTKPAKETA
ncbi:MAG: SDR family NAD(P)-dependent oxidoreductase [Pseudoruegeria sp.]